MALAEFLPLNKENWITHGNALRLDWLKVCPPTGTGGVKLVEDDLFQTPLDQPEFDFENEGGETYICGNPPYLGKGKLSKENKSVMGRQAIDLWPIVLSRSTRIFFAHTSFLWANNASHNAAVYVVIVGLEAGGTALATLFEHDASRQVDLINHYLTGGHAPLVKTEPKALSKELPHMLLGNKPNDGKKVTSIFKREGLDLIGGQCCVKVHSTIFRVRRIQLWLSLLLPVDSE